MKISTRQITLLAVLIAILIVLACVNIPQPGGLSITFNMIPVAIAAIAAGPLGGCVVGGAFGLISFLQCFGILGFSGMGAALTAIQPFLSFVQRFFPRLLFGGAVGLFATGARGRVPDGLRYALSGFLAAFLNTLFFMSTLVLFFGKTDYMQNLIAGRSVLAYMVAAVGLNGIVEMIVSTLVTGLVAGALQKAGAIDR